jgi:hypothetical protein
MEEAVTFTITEDDLTNAIFWGTTLEVEGSGSKAEARQQARLMLAAEELLDCCKKLLRICQCKCSPLDEDGQVNHETLTAAWEIITKVERRI